MECLNGMAPGMECSKEFAPDMKNSNVPAMFMEKYVSSELVPAAEKDVSNEFFSGSAKKISFLEGDVSLTVCYRSDDCTSCPDKDEVCFKGCAPSDLIDGPEVDHLVCCIGNLEKVKPPPEILLSGMLFVEFQEFKSKEILVDTGAGHSYLLVHDNSILKFVSASVNESAGIKVCFVDGRPANILG